MHCCLERSARAEEDAMPKNVIFLVHGMGKHPEGWSGAKDGPVAALVEAAKAYPGFSDADPLSNSVEFVEIAYDDLFDRIVTQWQTLAADLRAVSAFAPAQLAALTDAIAGLDPAQNWYASHALDVILYRGFAPVRRIVQLRVALQIMRTIADLGTAGRRFGVIAHSLGTTVAHDALHRLTQAKWFQPAQRDLLAAISGSDAATLEADIARYRERYSGNPFGVGTLEFSAIVMLANTSRLLHEGDVPDPAKSNVRPPLAEPDPQRFICRRFVNARHVLDPVGQVKAFRSEAEWPAAAARGLTRDVFGLKHVHDVNVHGFCHYLCHPLVHREIFLRLVPERFDGAGYQMAGQRVTGDGDFPQWGEKYRDEDQQDAILAKLGPLGSNATLRDLAGLYVALQGVVADLRKQTDT
jgi:hypothetical protein